MIIPADSILIQAGHSMNDLMQKTEDEIYIESQSNVIICNEENITGDQHFKKKTVIFQKNVDDFYHFYRSQGKNPTGVSNVLYARSHVVKGTGLAIVCAVGKNTQYGMSLSQDILDVQGNIINEENELKDILDAYTMKVGTYAYWISLLFLVLMVAREALEEHGVIESFTREERNSKAEKLHYFLNVFMYAIVLIVVIVPGALPLSVVYCLSEYSNLELFDQGKIIFKSIKCLDYMSRINCLLLEKQGSFTNNGNTQVKKLMKSGIDFCVEGGLESD